MSTEACTHPTHSADTAVPQEYTKPENNQYLKEALGLWIFEQLLTAFKEVGNSKEGKDGEKKASFSTPGADGNAQAIDGMAALDFFTAGYLAGSETKNLFIPSEDGSTTTESFTAPSSNGASGHHQPVRQHLDNHPSQIPAARLQNEEPNGGEEAPTTDGTNPDFDPVFNGETQSVYSLAATILLLTMKNKQSIVNNRLSQIEDTNAEVQKITTTIHNLKAVKDKLKDDSDKAKVDNIDLRMVRETNFDSRGALDETSTDQFFSELIGEGWQKKIEGEGQTELTKAQLNTVIEKLTSQSEALSTQNQTRNIKLQQQISELQVTTQMNSAIIDQIKTLGSGIAQRI